MDLFEAIYTRRSIRKFLDTPIEFDKLNEVMRAGSYAPCAGDLQNWRFILETNRDRIQELYHHTLEQEAFNSATAAIIVVAELEIAERFYGLRGKRLYSVQNCAAAVQNMLLAAHALGLGGVWIGAFDENRVNDAYKIPSTARAQAIVLLGYPNETPKERHVKHLWFVVNFHKWGMKYQHPHRIVHDLSDEWTLQRASLKRKADKYGEKLKERVRGKVGAEDEEGAVAPSTKALAKERAKDFFSDAQERTKGFLDSLKKKEYRERGRKEGVVKAPTTKRVKTKKKK